MLVALVPRLTGLQHLLDGGMQTFRVLQHQPVKLVPLLGRDIAALERLQIKTDRGDRCFQFVRDRVDKAIVLLVAPDFAHQKDGVQYQSGDDQKKEDRARERAERPRAS